MIVRVEDLLQLGHPLDRLAETLLALLAPRVDVAGVRGGLREGKGPVERDEVAVEDSFEQGGAPIAGGTP